MICKSFLRFFVLVLATIGPLAAQEPPSMVNDRLDLVSLVTDSDPATSTFSVIATFRNIGFETIADPFFDVANLSGQACPCTIEGGFSETFDTGPGGLTVSNSDPAAEGWAFNETCAPAATSPGGTGTLRWGDTGSCTAYGGPGVNDRALTRTASGGECSLSFDYYLDLGTPAAAAETKLRFRTADATIEEDLDLLNTAQWSSFSASTFSTMPPFRLEFVGAAQSVGTGAGWFIDDLVVDCFGSVEGDTIQIDLDDGFLEPGEAFTHRFDIHLTSFNSLVFFVDVWGVPIVQPVISTTPVLNFGEVFPGFDRTLPVVISNLGSVPLAVASITSDLAEFVPQTNDLLVPAGGSASVDVVFAPSGIGAFNGTLSIASDDPDAPVTTVPMTGSGVEPPVIDASPSFIGATAVSGALVTETLTLANTGQATLQFDVQVDWADPPTPPDAVFVHAAPREGTVAAGGSLDVQLYLGAAGLDAGASEALVTITSNDPTAPVITIPVTLDVTGAPHIEVLGDEVTLLSTTSFNTAGATTAHPLSVQGSPVGEGNFRLVAQGNFQTGTATLVVEGLPIVTVGPSGLVCSGEDASESLSAARFAGIAADGAIDVAVVNTNDVLAICSVNAHGPRVTYTSALESLDFGTVVLGETAERTVTIRNAGTEPLEVLSLAVDDPSFGVPQPPPAMAPGQSAEIGVTFSPAGGSEVQALLTITTNDPDQPTYSVDLAGAGNVPDIAVGVTELDFGEVFLGSSRTLLVPVTNQGNGALTISAITSDAAEFVPLQNSLTISGGATSNLLAVTFTPLAAADFGGTLTLVSNDLDTPTVQIPMTGSGRLPPTVGVDPSSLSAQLLSGGQEVQTLTISNTGGATLDYLIVLQFPSSPPFVVSQPATGSVPAGESGVVNVTFSAGQLTPGNYDATLFVQTNDPVTPITSVALTLTVVGAPQIQVTDGTPLTQFSSVDYFTSGATTEHQFDVQPPLAGNGLLSLTADGFYSTGTAKIFVEGAELATVGANGAGCSRFSTTVPVPSSVLEGAGGIVDVQIVNSPGVTATCDINEHQVRLTYSPALQLLEFGPTQLGEPKTLPIEIRNAGQGPLAVSSVVSDAGEFVPSPSALTVPAGEFRILDVTYTPSSEQVQTATLTITSDDPDDPVVQVELSGSGAPPPDISASPSSFSATLGTGELTTQPLSLSNTGLGPLDFTLSSEWVTEPVSPTAVYLHAEPTTGNVAPSGTQLVSLFLSAENLTAGDYEAQLVVGSNDPDTPELTIPGVLTVVDAPDIEVGGDLVTVESRIDYDVAGAVTQHVLALPVPSIGEATFELLAQGNFQSGGATVAAEGISIGALTPGGGLCSTRQLFATSTARRFALLGANGQVNVQFTNDPAVSAGCPVNAHTVRVTYLAELNEIDFGATFPGQTPQRIFIVHNDGTSALNVSDIVVDAPEFSVDVTAFELAPGESRVVQVSFTPAGTGVVQGLLQIESDDPDQPTLGVVLSALVSGPPSLTVDPLSLDETLPFGAQATRLLSLTNDGGSDLDYSVDVAWSGPNPPGPLFVQLLSPATGTLTPAGSVGLQLLLMAGRLTPGTFEAEATIASNDPSQPLVTVPITLEILATSMIQLSQASLDFGVVVPGNSSSLSFQIMNTGGGDLVVDAITSDSSAYVPSPSSLTVPPGGSETVGVVFTPPSGGPFNATLSISSNDPDSPQVGVSLSGVGLSTGSVTVDPTSLSSTLGVGGQEVQTLSLANGGEGNLEFTVTTSWAVEPDPLPPLFISAAPLAGTVPPGGTTGIDIEFRTLGLVPGTYHGLITIGSNDPDNPVVTVPATLQVGAVQNIGVDPTLLDFGPVPTDDDATLTLSISNTGEAPLIVDSIASSTPEFAPSVSSLTVAGGGTETVDVTFTPSAEVTFGGTLAIVSNDPDTPQVDVALAGVGTEVGPIIGVDPTSLDFGQVPTGDDATLVLSVSNTGDAELVVGSITSTAPEFAPSVSSLTVAIGGTETLDVTFTPSAGGDFSGSLVLAGNDPDTPQVNLPLAGTGVGSNLRLDHGTLNFGQVPVGGDNTLTLTVSNTGNAELIIDSITSSLSEYAGLPGSLTVAAGGTDTVTVTFTPSGVGSFNGTLTLAGNDAITPQIDVPLTGTGVGPSDTAIDPESISATLVTGGSGLQALTLSNAGLDRLDFTLAGAWVSGPVSPTSVFLHPEPQRGSVPPSGANGIDVHLSAENLPAGVYEANLLLSSNGAPIENLTVPASLTVVDAPDIEVSGDPVTVESTLQFFGAGAETQHGLALPVPPDGAGTLELIATGDFLSGAATLSAEGLDYGSTDAAGSACSEFSVTAPIEARQLALLAANDVVTVDVVNDSQVDAICPVNEHKVRLTYVPKLQAIDFGTVNINQPVVRTFVIHNDGTETLMVSALQENDFEYEPEGDFQIEPNESQLVRVTFRTPGTGDYDMTLKIFSNDPDEPALSIDFTVNVVIPPTGSSPIVPDNDAAPPAGDRGIVASDPATGEAEQQTHGRPARKPSFKLVDGKKGAGPRKR